MKTQGEIEGAICEGIHRFEQEHRAGAPRAFAPLIGDFSWSACEAVLTAAEQHLVKALSGEKGRYLHKQLRTQLIETARPIVEAIVQDIAGVRVLRLHHDVSTVPGEEIVIFTLAESPFVA